MPKKIFNEEEIYDLLNADHAAYSLQNETGCCSGWYEFASEDDYREKFNSLGNEEGRFEEKLRETTILVENRFDELENLSDEDYEDEREFWEARREIQDEIMGRAYDNLKEYMIEQEEIHMIPKDPMMLLSYVNTQLRDFYPDLAAFCQDKGVDAEEITEKLRGVDYEYDEKSNRFV